MNDVSLNGKVYDVSNDCSLIDKNNILNIHKYLIKKKHKIKRDLGILNWYFYNVKFWRTINCRQCNMFVFR